MGDNRRYDIGYVLDTPYKNQVRKIRDMTYELVLILPH
jgi:hypothetical protein